MAQRIIAKYNGSTVHTRILEAKQVNKSLQTNLKEDLTWNAANRWTLDVTDAPQEILDYLDEDDDFKLQKREVDAEEDSDDSLTESADAAEGVV